MSLLVNPLQTGPMIGHTTTSGFRLWGRAKNKSKNIVGIARIRRSDSHYNNEHFTFEFNPDYDNCAIVDFGKLDQNDSTSCSLEAYTEYIYEIGWVFADSKAKLDEAIEAGENIVWGKPNVPDLNGMVRTFPEPNKSIETTFILGSCRDPLGNKGEKTFDTISAQLDNNDDRPDFILMTGDQIYIDHINIKKFRPSLKKYWKQYRKAFGLPKFNKVTRQIPTYMMMDDHEVQNNWTFGKFKSNEDKPKKKQKYHVNTLKYGLRSYEAYQASLSPLLATPKDFKLNGFPLTDSGTRYWYQFQHGDSDFFVLDTRGESEIREKEENNDAPEILGIEQCAKLFAWLSDGHSQIKFIVSPIPFFPDTRGFIGSAEDKWFLAAEQRLKIIDHIRDLPNAPKVIILSGDVHISGIAQLTHKHDSSFKIHNIISSAFNWVAPGLQENNFAWGKLVSKKTTSQMVNRGNAPWSNYESKSLLKTKFGSPKIFKRNNFAVISVKPTTGSTPDVTVKFIQGNSGEPLYDSTIVI